MISQVLKDLFEEGKYQEVLDQLSQKETQGEYASLSEDEKILWCYYQSRSLEMMGQFEEALKQASAAHLTLVAPNDTSLLLPLLIAQLYALQRLGRLDEALETTKKCKDIIDVLTAKERRAGAHWIALFENIKGNIYWQKGDWDTALEHYQQSLALREQIGNKSDIAVSLNNIGVIYHSKGELNSAIDYYQRSLTLREALGNKRDIAVSLINIGALYRQKGELDSALDYYKRGLDIHETIGNKREIAASLNNIGVIYRQKGLLNMALDYLRRSLTLKELLGNKQDIASTLNNLGNVYLQKGELDSALDYHQRALALYEATRNKPAIAKSLRNLGKIHHLKGELNTALEFFQESLVLNKVNRNDIETAETLFCLILLFLEQQNQLEAQEYLTQLQKLHNRTPNRKIHLERRLGEALILKQSKEIKNTIQAQTILENILDEGVVEHHLTVLAMLNLSEILLERLKTSHEQEVWKKAHSLVKRLLDIAEQQASHWLLVCAFVLQAQIMFLELRQSWTFEKNNRLKTLLEQIQRVSQDKHLLIILTQGHLLLAMFYSDNLRFSEAKAELNKAHAIITEQKLFKERYSLEEQFQQVSDSEATYSLYLDILDRVFEQDKHSRHRIRLEQAFMKSIDYYMKLIKTSLSALD
ncbi:MAG: tetratricopeptide repeat protein [Candidatus Hermodarchaeota archaeon]